MKEGGIESPLFAFSVRRICICGVCTPQGIDCGAAAGGITRLCAVLPHAASLAYVWCRHMRHHLVMCSAAAGGITCLCAVPPQAADIDCDNPLSREAQGEGGLYLRRRKSPPSPWTPPTILAMPSSVRYAYRVLIPQLDCSLHRRAYPAPRPDGLVNMGCSTAFRLCMDTRRWA